MKAFEKHEACGGRLSANGIKPGQFQVSSRDPRQVPRGSNMSLPTWVWDVSWLEPLTLFTQKKPVTVGLAPGGGLDLGPEGTMGSVFRKRPRSKPGEQGSSLQEVDSWQVKDRT